jgi:AhpD family alkylhydroperoxidase
MYARMKNPLFVVPEALQNLLAFAASTKDAGVPEQMLELLYMRASQINGCSVCVEMHAEALRKAGETDERVAAIGAWEDSPRFTEAERAALALTEATTRISDRSNPVPDEIWDEAARHFDEKALASLVLNIGLINLFNRVNVPTRQVAGVRAA